MRKICVVVTARPSYARIKTALRAIEEHPDLELQLVVGASALLERYGRVVDVLKQDGFRPVAEAHMVIEGEHPISAAKTAGLGIVELSSILHRLNSDAVLSVADRYETIATAISAAYMNIPVVHVQGGEVTGSIDEKVRHAVTKLADLHFVSNESAAKRVIAMGESKAAVHVTGCPSIDLAADVQNRRDDPALLASVEKYVSRGVGSKLDVRDGYIVCMQHPVTYEWERSGFQIMETMHAIIEMGKPCYWFWPNIDAGSEILSKAIRTYREKNAEGNVHFLKNMPPEEFLSLLSGAQCLVGNSSTGIREAAFLGVPTIDIGTRQAGRDRAPNVTNTPYDRTEILAALKNQLDHGSYESDSVYGDGKAGQRFAEILAHTKLTSEKKLTY